MEDCSVMIAEMPGDGLKVSSANNTRKTGFVFRRCLVVGIDGSLHIRMFVPEVGMTEKEFNVSALRRDREFSIKRRRGKVACLMVHQGSKYMSPHELPINELPAEALRILDESTEGLFLYCHELAAP